MRIVIAGGSGFLGVALAETCAEEGHDVRVLTRQLPPGEARHDPGTGMPGVTRVGWRPDGRSGVWAEAVNGADAVVNLAGANLGGARWTPERKAILHDSRIMPTRSLAAAITESRVRPPVFISASGVGLLPTGADRGRKGRRRAPTFSRNCARHGRQKRRGPRAQRPGWSTSVPGSSWSEAAACCQE